MDPELATGLPSTRYIQQLIKEGQEVEVKLLTEDRHTGIVFWQDPRCLCLKDQSGQLIIVWWHALASLRPKA